MMRRSPAAQPEPFIRPSQTPDPAHQTRTLMHRPSGRQAPAAKAESSAAIRSMKWYAGRTVPPNPQPPLQGKQSSPDERSESMPAEAAAKGTAPRRNAQTRYAEKTHVPPFSHTSKHSFFHLGMDANADTTPICVQQRAKPPPFPGGGFAVCICDASKTGTAAESRFMSCIFSLSML